MGICKPPFIWLVPFSETYSAGLELLADSEFYLMEKNGSATYLTEAYRTSLSSPLTFQHFGVWTNGSSNLQLKTEQEKYDRRKLTGVNIRVASIKVE